ncbi:E3 SUMO-protein ligase pli1 [Tieghemiomyces parasiticus]|uniref:E3 SUMO-protein ligase pli1 n=1 Tax=Tieghemiomyces parasiticus TaxID=78921 RepID=A0A9W8DIH9_9FUNG|nr:E3 SUMO-protein ligase pli1 [Tieghemiomyces parasiticus]
MASGAVPNTSNPIRDYDEAIEKLIPALRVDDIKAILRYTFPFAQAVPGTNFSTVGLKPVLVARVLDNYRAIQAFADPAISSQFEEAVESHVGVPLADVANRLGRTRFTLTTLNQLRIENAQRNAQNSHHSQPASPAASVILARTSRPLPSLPPPASLPRSPAASAATSHPAPGDPSTSSRTPARLPPPLPTSRRHPSPASLAPTPTPLPPISLVAPKLLRVANSQALAGRPRPLQNLRFKKSPFFSIDCVLETPIICNEAPTRPGTALLRFSVDTTQDAELTLTKKHADRPICHRLMLFMTTHEAALASYRPEHEGISPMYPRLASIKVNGTPMPQRTLDKHTNKVKQINPIDLTSLYDNRYPNHRVEVTYYSTQRMTALMAYCRVTRASDLVALLTKTNTRSKEDIVRQATKEADDDELVISVNSLSLKCPLSHTRLRHPCRTLACTHMQCFDAESFLLVNAQSPSWKCPVCNCPAIFDDLFIDGYTADILQRVATSVDQVQVDADLTWHMPEAVDSFVIGDDEEDSEDDGEAQQPVKMEPGTPVSQPSTTATQSPTGSVAVSSVSAPKRFLPPPTPTGVGAPKRPRLEVIDLTMSDDEEEEEAEEERAVAAAPALVPFRRGRMATVDYTNGGWATATDVLRSI